MLDGPEKFTYISSLLSSEEKEQLQHVLLRNIDMFAWNHSNMIIINPMLVSHKLNIISVTKSIRQKMRRFHSDRHKLFKQR